MSNLAFGLEFHDTAVRRADRLGANMNVEEMKNISDGEQAFRVIVVACYDNRRNVQASQFREEVERELFGFGRRGLSVENVASDENSVDLFAANDVEDLRERRFVFVAARAAL